MKPPAARMLARPLPEERDAIADPTRAARSPSDNAAVNPGTPTGHDIPEALS